MICLGMLAGQLISLFAYGNNGDWTYVILGIPARYFAIDFFFVSETIIRISKAGDKLKVPAKD